MDDELTNKKDKNNKIFNEFKDLLSGEWKAPVDARLTEITPLSEMDQDKYEFIIQALNAFYQSSDPTHRRFGSVLNSIYTQGLSTFVLTKSFTDKLVKSDPHYTPNSCDTIGYKKMMNFALSNNILKVLRNPVRNDVGIPGKSGLYELVDKKCLGLLYMIVGESVCLARKEVFIKWYDTNNEQIEVQEELTPEIIEERRRAREIRDEIFGKRK